MRGTYILGDRVATIAIEAQIFNDRLQGQQRGEYVESARPRLARYVAPDDPRSAMTAVSGMIAGGLFAVVIGAMRVQERDHALVPEDAVPDLLRKGFHVEEGTESPDGGVRAVIPPPTDLLDRIVVQQRRLLERLEESTSSLGDVGEEINDRAAALAHDTIRIIAEHRAGIDLAIEDDPMIRLGDAK